MQTQKKPHELIGIPIASGCNEEVVEEVCIVEPLGAKCF